MCMRTSVLAAAAVLALACGPVYAKASASAEITKLSFTLYDLDPNDGISPGISFVNGASQSFASNCVDGSCYSDDAYGTSPFDPVSAGVGTAYGAAMAEITGGGTMDSATARASGWIIGGGSVENVFSAYGYLTSSDFVLTPWTAIRFDAEATVDAETTIGTLDEGNHYEYAFAGATIQLVTSFDGGWSYHTAERLVGATYSWYWDEDLGRYVYTGASWSSSGAFSLSFANLSAEEATGYFTAYASAYGRSPYAVPEPETQALMFVGLALVGWVARRRHGAR